MRHRTGIFAVVLVTASLCALAVGFGASAADAPGVTPQGRAAGFVLQVRIPGVEAITHAPAISRGGSASASGGFATQPDPSIASVLTADTTVKVEATDVAARGDATTRAAGITLLDGLVTATAVTSQSAALAATTTEAQSALQSTVDGLVVAGQPVEATPNKVIEIAGVGDLVVEESVDAVRGPQAARTFAIGLHLRLRQEYRGLPAGTEIMVGYADSGAEVPDPTSLTQPDPLTPLPSPTGPISPVIGASSQDPPPGGYTANPPITQQHVDELLDGTYMFPVLGATASDYSDDFGAPRATTGFHQGIDIFGAAGTPILAINDGVLSNVGWNNFGGRRFWLTDRYGNQFYFAHLSGFSPLAKEGAQVKRGDVIAFLGNSGDAQGTPPHLHFEIHPAGGWAVPPLQYVTSWLTGVRQPVVATPLAPPPVVVTVPAAPAKPKPKPKPIETLPVTTPAPTATQGPAPAPAPEPAPPATIAPPVTTAPPATTAPAATDTTSTGATTAAITGTGTVFSG